MKYLVVVLTAYLISVHSFAEERRVALPLPKPKSDVWLFHFETPEPIELKYPEDGVEKSIIIDSQLFEVDIASYHDMRLWTDPLMTKQLFAEQTVKRYLIEKRPGFYLVGVDLATKTVKIDFYARYVERAVCKKLYESYLNREEIDVSLAGIGETNRYVVAYNTANHQCSRFDLAAFQWKHAELLRIFKLEFDVDSDRITDGFVALLVPEPTNKTPD